jgi:hypothetical protein
MEAEIMKFMAKVVFIGLGFAAVSGALLFYTDPAKYLASSKFPAKMVIFCIITLNGIALHNYMLPRLIHVVFSKDTQSNWCPILESKSGDAQIRMKLETAATSIPEIQTAQKKLDQISENQTFVICDVVAESGSEGEKMAENVRRLLKELQARKS